MLFWDALSPLCLQSFKIFKNETPHLRRTLWRLQLFVIERAVCAHSAQSITNDRQAKKNVHLQQSSMQATPDLQSGSSCRNWGGRSVPSSADTLGTPPCSRHTGSPCSLVSRTPPRLHSPPGWSCSGSGRCENLSSHCRTHSDGPGSSCPRRRRSEGGTHNSLSARPPFTFALLGSLKPGPCLKAQTF